MLERIKMHFSEDIVSYTKMKGGYTNVVYRIDLEDKSLIYKEYRGINRNEKYILSIIRIPKILINDDNYRIEEYLENTPIDYHKDMEGIVASMKEMHLLIKQEENSDLKIPFFSFKMLLKDLLDKVGDGVCKSLEMKIYKLVDDNAYKLGLCHNDLHSYNMLKTKDGIVIIDYEFSTIGNVLFDIANLFCETHFDYTNCVFDLKKGFNKEDEERFLKYYFEDVEQVYTKVQNLKIVGHYLWILWAIPKSEDINEFDYLKNARERLREIEKTGFLNDEELGCLMKLTNKEDEDQ